MNTDKNNKEAGAAADKSAQNCLQCGKSMNPVEWMLGAVCGKCCRENHRRVVGK
jgi:hypothetical protein